MRKLESEKKREKKRKKGEKKRERKGEKGKERERKREGQREGVRLQISLLFAKYYRNVIYIVFLRQNFKLLYINYITLNLGLYAFARSE